MVIPCPWVDNLRTIFLDPAIAMVQKKHQDSMPLIPASALELDAVRKHCRRLVLRRATLSAGIAAVPVPGLDIITAFSMLARLIDDINRAFGLTPAQIDRLQPALRLATYELIRRTGNAVVGKLITRQLTAMVLQRLGMKIAVKHSAKIVPVAGQVVSAAIGFSAFRMIGHQHIDACVAVATELVVLHPAAAATKVAPK